MSPRFGVWNMRAHSILLTWTTSVDRFRGQTDRLISKLIKETCLMIGYGPSITGYNFPLLGCRATFKRAWSPPCSSCYIPENFWPPSFLRLRQLKLGWQPKFRKVPCNTWGKLAWSPSLRGVCYCIPGRLLIEGPVMPFVDLYDSCIWSVLLLSCLPFHSFHCVRDITWRWGADRFCDSCENVWTCCNERDPRSDKNFWASAWLIVVPSMRRKSLQSRFCVRMPRYIL